MKQGFSFAEEGEFETIFKSNFPRLCQLAFRILGDTLLTEDVVQDVFVKIWQKRTGLKIKQTPEAYLTRAVVNASLNQLEKNKTGGAKVTVEENQQTSAITPLHSLEADELSLKLSSIVERLPPQCRVVFSLSRCEGMPNQEIADHLGITKKTVENQLNKALKTLREKAGHLIKLAIKLSPLLLFGAGW